MNLSKRPLHTCRDRRTVEKMAKNIASIKLNFQNKSLIRDFPSGSIGNDDISLWQNASQTRIELIMKSGSRNRQVTLIQHYHKMHPKVIA